MKEIYLVEMGVNENHSVEPHIAFSSLEKAKEYVLSRFKSDMKELKEFETSSSLAGIRIGNSHHIYRIRLEEE